MVLFEEDFAAEVWVVFVVAVLLVSAAAAGVFVVAVGFVAGSPALVPLAAVVALLAGPGHQVYRQYFFADWDFGAAFAALVVAAGYFFVGFAAPSGFAVGRPVVAVGFAGAVANFPVAVAGYV